MADLRTVSVNSTSSNDLKAQIILGPVIGYCSDTTARVLIETNRDCTITCVVTPNGEFTSTAAGTNASAGRTGTGAALAAGSAGHGAAAAAAGHGAAAAAAGAGAGAGAGTADSRLSAGVARRLEVAFRKGRPGVFRFYGLPPNTNFDVSFVGAGNEDKRKGSFHTLPEVVTNLRLVCAACDKDKKKSRGPVNMWERLWDDHVAPDAEVEPIDLLVHHGDQVYADHAFAAAKHFFDDKTDLRTPGEKIVAAREAYQMIYRRVWNRPETARVLANVANICMWDDHEVRNDWGTFPEDRDSRTAEYQIGQGARQAYWWYQRQLWDDLPGSEDDVLAARAACSGLRAVVEEEEKAALSDGVSIPDAGDAAAPEGTAAGAGRGTEAVAKAAAEALASAAEDDSGAGAEDDAAAGVAASEPVATGVVGLDGDGAAGEAEMKEGGSPSPRPPRESRSARSVRSVELSLASSGATDTLAPGVIADITTECVSLLLPGGKVGLFLSDMRGSRSFYYDGVGRTFFGEAQWKVIDHNFGKGGLFEDCGSVMCVHSSPAVFFGNSCSKMCKCLSEDKMGLGLHPEEQEQYLDTLCAWKRLPRAAGPRDLLLIGGDMHFSMRTEVKHSGDVVLRQVTSSALSNKPPFWFQFYLFRAIMGCCPRNNEYTWSHGEFFPAQNFVRVMLTESGKISETVTRSRYVCCDYRGCCYC